MSYSRQWNLKDTKSDFITKYSDKEVWKVEQTLIKVIDEIVSEETNVIQKEKERLESGVID